MRDFDRTNWYGLYTLASKEIGRFMKVKGQTIAAPVISALLYYLVFSVAMKGHPGYASGVAYLQFLAPGLMIMSMAQNAFANASSSLVIAKVQGNIVDVLMAPLSAGELVTAYVVGGVARGFLVGAASAVTLFLLIPMHIAYPLHALFHALSGSMMLATLGLIGGIWADRFDRMAAAQNFVILPLTFLSGTFFSVHQLPSQWQFLCHLNPIFYMIDGFRYGFTGVSDTQPILGVAAVSLTNIVLLGGAYAMLRTGYKLKS